MWQKIKKVQSIRASHSCSQVPLLSGIPPWTCQVLVHCSPFSFLGMLRSRSSQIDPAEYFKFFGCICMYVIHSGEPSDNKENYVSVHCQ